MPTITNEFTDIVTNDSLVRWELLNNSSIDVDIIVWNMAVEDATVQPFGTLKRRHSCNDHWNIVQKIGISAFVGKHTVLTRFSLLKLTN